MYIMPICPHCNSDNTGKVSPRCSFTMGDERRVNQVAARKGIRYHLVSSEDYKLYQSANRNYHCFDCGYDFFAEDEEEYDYNKTEDYQHKMKESSQIYEKGETASQKKMKLAGKKLVTFLKKL